MITTYFRSSSLNNWSYCQLQYFLTYVLGHYSPSGQKADMGTITHAVFETLAISKKRLQTGKRKTMKVTHDPLGDFSFSESELYTDEFVYKVLNRSFEFYKKHCSHNTFDSKSYDFCEKMVWDTLRYNSGQFDPRNRTIVDTEPHFDFAIDEPWAKFSFDGPDGKIEGNLAVKGTIDLITELPDRTIEVIDWKGLPISTVLPTLNGWRTMETVKVGDYLFDKDGLPTRIVGKSKPSVKQCKEVLFTNGMRVICDVDHLWALNSGETKNVLDLVPGDKLIETSNINIIYLNMAKIDHRFKTALKPLEVFAINNAPEHVTQCVMVDSPSSTYLCTRDFIPTHNTGQRLDWATGEKKDYSKLMKDTQLLLYYYAIGRLYPKYQHRIMTIFFCRDGGPFTLAYDDEDMAGFMDYLKNIFQEISMNQNPKPRSRDRSDFRCTKLCHYYKNNWPGTDQTICHYTEEKLHTIGMNETVKQMTRPGFAINMYKDPGAV